MSFLPDFSKKRTTFSSDFTEDNDSSIDFLDDEDEEFPSCLTSGGKSKHDYKQKSTPSKSKSKSTENSALVELLGGYLKESKETIDAQIELQNNKKESPYATALSYWDTLLNNMPPQQAQLTVIKITNMIHEASLKVLNKDK
ncbi:hypothetical protein M5D96_008643 [Drosophila gunungcola]|uniref:Uncharacterized protein n=2 Tax=Drosophila gunungcola TaxID=103775 RepID=A0A9Q0BP47_9MUSC|nr:hypothetical protein M5D96_008643 [Drosophila gunungcola]